MCHIFVTVCLTCDQISQCIVTFNGKRLVLWYYHLINRYKHLANG